MIRAIMNPTAVKRAYKFAGALGILLTALFLFNQSLPSPLVIIPASRAIVALTISVGAMLVCIQLVITLKRHMISNFVLLSSGLIVMLSGIGGSKNEFLRSGAHFDFLLAVPLLMIGGIIVFGFIFGRHIANAIGRIILLKNGTQSGRGPLQNSRFINHLESLR
jgi:hypothetical protein